MKLIFFILFAVSVTAFAGEIPKVFPDETFSSGDREHLFWEYGFDTGWNAYVHTGRNNGRNNDAPKWKQSQMQGTYSGRTKTQHKREGGKAMRFEWRLNNVAEGNNTSKKAHLFTLKDPTAHEDRWWGFSTYLPSDGMARDHQQEIIAQWHGTPDGIPGRREAYRNPPITLSVNKDRMKVSWIYDAREITPQGWDDWDRTTVDVGFATKDQWIDWVFRIKWAPLGGGVLQVWRNAVPVVNKQNIKIGFNDLLGTYFGIGIYKWTGRSKYNKRVIWFDSVRGASEEGSFSSVTPWVE